MQFRCIILLLLVLLFTSNKAESRVADSVCAASLRQKSFVFQAQWATGQGGIRRQLAPPYQLSVCHDTLIAYLPFYGRMYRVPTPQELRFMNIDLSSTSFGYDLKQNKRDIWNLHITPKDQKDVQSLRFNITKGCESTLWVRSVGRDPMLYEGIILPLP